MEATAPTCVNHPREATRVSCSSCGQPICTRCMRPSAVGQKCPDCARAPRSARAVGKPIHYVRAVGVGLPLATAGGVAMLMLLVVMQRAAGVSFGVLILSALIGFGVGRAVAWGVGGQTQNPFPAVAAGCAVLGLMAAYAIMFGTPVPQSLWSLLGVAAAGYFAVRGLHR